jgi:single-strand DNA-binding protein
MANFNKVVLIGRLTRDPETRAFSNGGMVAKIGFAVTNRKKNSQTGQWEDEPMFIDCEAFNRGEFGKTADVIRDYCRKGSQILIEGRLHLDTWQDKTTGQNRSKHKIVIDNVQLLDRKQDGPGGGMGGGGGEMHDDMDAPPPARSAPPRTNNVSRGPAPAKAGYSANRPDEEGDEQPANGDDIPF